jgi:hypothetical protein
MKKKKNVLRYLWVNHKATMFIVVMGCLVLTGTISLVVATVDWRNSGGYIEEVDENNNKLEQTLPSGFR